jgi:hypothetical protein
MTPRVRRPSRRPRLSRRRLTALVEEALIDAYGESEQRVGLLCMLQEHLAVPFTTEILETPVRVIRIDLNDAEEIVAVCLTCPVSSDHSSLENSARVGLC